MIEDPQSFRDDLKEVFEKHGLEFEKARMTIRRKQTAPEPYGAFNSDSHYNPEGTHVSINIRGKGPSITSPTYKDTADKIQEEKITRMDWG